MIRHGRMIRRPQGDKEPRVANALPQSLKQEAQGRRVAAHVEIANADHWDAVPLKPIDRVTRHRLMWNDFRAQAMFLQELGQDRSRGVVQWTASGDALDRLFVAPFGGQFRALGRRPSGGRMLGQILCGVFVNRPFG